MKYLKRCVLKLVLNYIFFLYYEDTNGNANIGIMLMSTTNHVTDFKYIELRPGSILFFATHDILMAVSETKFDKVIN